MVTEPALPALTKGMKMNIAEKVSDLMVKCLNGSKDGAAANLVFAWDNKNPISWQPDGHHQLLESLRAAIAKAQSVT